MKSHQAFKAKYGIPFTLLADTDGKLSDAFAITAKRSTFLIDAQGRISKVWSPVTVDGHAAEVYAAIG